MPYCTCGKLAISLSPRGSCFDCLVKAEQELAAWPERCEMEKQHLRELITGLKMIRETLEKELAAARSYIHGIKETIKFYYRKWEKDEITPIVFLGLISNFIDDPSEESVITRALDIISRHFDSGGGYEREPSLVLMDVRGVLEGKGEKPNANATN